MKARKLVKQTLKGLISQQYAIPVERIKEYSSQKIEALWYK